MINIKQLIVLAIISALCVSILFVVLFSFYDHQTKPKHMSSIFLKIISTQPEFVPAKVSQINVQTYLKKIFANKKVEIIETEDVQFIDQGMNFENVACNYCGKEINTWQDMMNEAHKKQFTDLSVVTPCCHKKSSLNDLIYHSPAGFAKFVISIPDAQKDITSNEVIEIEKILGTRVRKIWVHY